MKNLVTRTLNDDLLDLSLKTYKVSKLLSKIIAKKAPQYMEGRSENTNEYTKKNIDILVKLIYEKNYQKIYSLFYFIEIANRIQIKNIFEYVPIDLEVEKYFYRKLSNIPIKNLLEYRYCQKKLYQKGKFFFGYEENQEDSFVPLDIKIDDNISKRKANYFRISKEKSIPFLIVNGRHPFFSREIDSKMNMRIFIPTKLIEWGVDKETAMFITEHTDLS